MNAKTLINSEGIRQITKNMILAEIYALAMGNDYVFETKEKHLGFNPEPVQRDVIAKPSRNIGFCSPSEVPASK